jgi:hypothetical protein
MDWCGNKRTSGSLQAHNPCIGIEVLTKAVELGRWQSPEDRESHNCDILELTMEDTVWYSPRAGKSAMCALCSEIFHRVRMTNLTMPEHHRGDTKEHGLHAPSSICGGSLPYESKADRTQAQAQRGLQSVLVFLYLYMTLCGHDDWLVYSATVVLFILIIVSPRARFLACSLLVCNANTVLGFPSYSSIQHQYRLAYSGSCVWFLCFLLHEAESEITIIQLTVRQRRRRQ